MESCYFSCNASNEKEAVFVAAIKMMQGKQSRQLEDRISWLPDCLLVEIISRLPETKYAIRTGTLSKRWQHLWPQLPNLIIQNYYVDNFPQFYSSVERILSQRDQSNLNKLELHCCYTNQNKSQLNNCIRNAINHNVQEVDIDLNFHPHDNGFVLPEFFFICSSFIHLTLSHCSFEQADIISWKNLRTLHIEDVELDEDVIKNIFSGSPLLEILELDFCYGFERIDVINKSLQNLSLKGCSNDVLEINAPYILSLAFKGYLLLNGIVLLNVSSVIRVELDYWLNHPLMPIPEEVEEEMLKGLILSLRQVKNLQIGDNCLGTLAPLEAKTLARLKAKGFTFPSNMKKYLDWCGSASVEDEDDSDSHSD
ncbi:F-box/LRR-repeat protein 25-like protein [Tanacetum coccineum]